MATIKVLLHVSKVAANAGDIFLEATVNGDDVTLTHLVLPNSQKFSFKVPPTEKLDKWLDKITNDVFKFKATVTIEIPPLEFVVTGAEDFFGRKVQVGGEVLGKLFIRIPANEAPPCTIELQAKIEVIVNGVAVFIDDVRYRIEIDKLATDQTPEDFFPSLHIDFPSLGLSLPELTFEPTYPQLPPMPWRLPSYSTQLGPLPIRVGYKSLTINVVVGAATEVTLDIRSLKLEADLGVFEADVAVNVTQKKIDVKVLRPRVQDLPVEIRSPAAGCILMRGDQSHVNDLLAWILPEFDSLQLTGRGKWVLQILYDSSGVHEVRLDIQPEATQRISLPVLDLSVPKDTTYHLICARDGKKRPFVMLALSLKLQTGQDANKELLEAGASLAWITSLGETELNKDAKQPQLFAITVTPKAQDRTIVVSRIPLDDRKRLTFFQQEREDALGFLDFDATTATPLPDDFKDINIDHWTVGLKSDLPTPDEPFTLPFLKSAEQFITVKLTSTKIDSLSSVELTFDVIVTVLDLRLEGSFTAKFLIDRFALFIDPEKGIEIYVKKDLTGSVFGFNWTLNKVEDAPSFRLFTKGSNFQIKQLRGSEFTLRFDKATTEGTAIEFKAANFGITQTGIDLDATVTNSPAKLNAINTVFNFTEGTFQVRSNQITSFTIAGSGPLPPELVGPSDASIHLQFAQEKDRSIALVSADARLECNKLICDDTRFQFTVTAIGLKFVDDGGRYHLYFTLSGKARFVLGSGDDPEGPLGWLPSLELELVECPLTTDVSVLARHIKFLIPLPKPKTFPFLGCFEFELRAIGFAPMDIAFREPKPAMLLTGQIKFAQGGGDAISAEVDFHDLHIGLPAKGKKFPQLHLQGLGLKISQGTSFELGGSVDFYDEGTEFEGGVVGEGFSGRGELTIQGLPKFTAGFAFLRVRRKEGGPPVRAWFIFVQAERFSVLIPIPIMQVYLREVGLGFGYRFTLAMIKSMDEINDPNDGVLPQRERDDRFLSPMTGSGRRSIRNRAATSDGQSASTFLPTTVGCPSR